MQINSLFCYCKQCMLSMSLWESLCLCLNVWIHSICVSISFLSVLKIIVTCPVLSHDLGFHALGGTTDGLHGEWPQLLKHGNDRQSKIVRLSRVKCRKRLWEGISLYRVTEICTIPKSQNLSEENITFSLKCFSLAATMWSKHLFPFMFPHCTIPLCEKQTRFKLLFTNN